MSKHTPGPWVKDYGPTPGHIKSCGVAGWTPTVARYDLCALSVTDDREANGHLIAAAPELLAACRRLLEVVEPNDVPGSRTNVAIKLAEDAIRKAAPTAPDSAPAP